MGYGSFCWGHGSEEESGLRLPLVTGLCGEVRCSVTKRRRNVEKLDLFVVNEPVTKIKSLKAFC